MGPKKKEEEIDLTTLPECTSLNIILLAKGKKSRSSNILEKVQQNGLKFMIKIKKNDVLDHAKEKSIYIDPNSLTDKQKKDPKFMESVNTELTAEVIAKATQSLIGTHILKARIVFLMSFRRRRIIPMIKEPGRMTCFSSLKISPKRK